MTRTLTLALALTLAACYDGNTTDRAKAPDGVVEADTGVDARLYDTDDTDEADTDADADTDSDTDADSDADVTDVDDDGYSAGVDCDDQNDLVFPGATEYCDGLDNDCDGEIDEDATGASTWYYDADGDSYGNAAISVIACGQPSGYVANATDCRDTNDGVYPNATEYVNGIDDDCDGEVDETDTVEPDPEDTSDTGYLDDTGEVVVMTTWYADVDSDGYGDAESSVKAETQPTGYVSDNTDCRDTSNSVHPGASEVIGNEIDDDCDGEVDETDTVEELEDTGLVEEDPEDEELDDTGTEPEEDPETEDTGTEPILYTWYLDVDSDGYGDDEVSVESETQPTGYVANNTDCDDADVTTNPAVEEIGDLVDNDCNGQTDEGWLVVGIDESEAAAGWSLCYIDYSTWTSMWWDGTGSDAACEQVDAGETMGAVYIGPWASIHDLQVNGDLVAGGYLVEFGPSTNIDFVAVEGQETESSDFGTGSSSDWNYQSNGLGGYDIVNY